MRQCPNGVAAENARVMIVLCNDCGLLAEAMYFLSGQSFKDRATLVLPPRLFDLNPDDFGVRTQRYSTFQELVEIVDKESPDVVLFFSGYLMIHHELLSERSLEDFIDFLKTRGCKIATSDPLGGVMSSAVTYSASSQAELNCDMNYSEIESAILSIFIPPYEILKTITHIYPYPYETAKSKCHSILSYFNPRKNTFEKEPTSQDEPEISLDSTFCKPFWFFTLGPQDYELQCEQIGKDQLITTTARNFQWISDSGRNVVFVGPSDLVQALEGALPASDKIQLFSFLPYMKFEALNLEAEYAFYWNVASASALFRELNGLPTFHFCIGHIGEKLYPVYKEVVRLFYADSEPMMLDQTQSFDIEKLEELSRRTEEHTSKILKSFESLPYPEALIEKLMHLDNQQ